jgi:hypothetical protein
MIRLFRVFGKDVPCIGWMWHLPSGNRRVYFDNDKNRRYIVLGHPGHPLLGVDPIETAVSLLIRLKRLSIARADGAATLKL